MILVYNHDGIVINVDNNDDSERLISLSAESIDVAIFDGLEACASNANTKKVLGEWHFDRTLVENNQKDYLFQTEIQWRDTELSKILNRVDQYEKDQNYPVELRTSPFTAEQFNQLLQDRKLLCDYPSVDNFPFVERPKLSGLV
ncbi:hypothetical protein [Moritella sp.]|uniref:hypothetical protein n=1 Tax=Moritella sp. TaxID=78556 RepID=UPI0025E49278|nr:hypothetical protein [Moritella sp.]MCJ8348311.1 hypothetical protein [Moritella sp.]